MSLLRLLMDGALGNPLMKRRARYVLVGELAKRWGFRVHHADSVWHQEPRFLQALSEFPAGGGLTAKRFNLFNLAGAIATVPGDTAECGVATGVTTFLIWRATARPGRIHWGFDSFEGLPAPGEADVPGHDVEPLRAGMFSVPYALACESLSRCDGVVLSQGWIPECLERVSDREFSFVHVDVDFFEPTLAALEFFYPRLSSGGMLVCDDYGFRGTPGAREAVNRFVRDGEVPFAELASGQACLFKR